MGAFDAADSWDFTYGATAEWTQDWWTARAGVQLSQIPNGEVINGDLWGGERTRSA
jgi:high affinity Mn2+ porin